MKILWFVYMLKCRVFFFNYSLKGPGTYRGLWFLIFLFWTFTFFLHIKKSPKRGWSERCGLRKGSCLLFVGEVQNKVFQNNFKSIIRFTYVVKFWELLLCSGITRTQDFTIPFPHPHFYKREAPSMPQTLEQTVLYPLHNVCIYIGCFRL